MSLRERIQKFEALGQEKDDNKSSEKRTNQAGQGKRFYYPGKHSQMSNEPSVMIPQAKAKQNTFPNYEADLQEVWSVKKNIHHTNSIMNCGNTNHRATHNKFSQSYSRHGAIPAQSAGDSQMGHFPIGRSLRKRSPLQEQNEGKTWNLRTPGFSYTERVKQSTECDSPPQTKRKLAIREESPKSDIPPIRSFFFQSQEQNEKKSYYAQRMVQGHLKSVGLGKYTPDAGYTREQENDKTVWKKTSDQDEFSFD